MRKGINKLASTALLMTVVLLTLLCTGLVQAGRANAEHDFSDTVVSVVSMQQGHLYYGDEVTLYAEAEGCTEGCELIWQAGHDGSWTTVQLGGSSYSFVLTEENANLEYRVVLAR